MQLLLSRSQKPRSYGRVKFSLWVQFDLTDEEKELIKKYHVSDASITLGNRNRDLRRAFLPAVAVTILAYIVVVVIPFTPFNTWTQFYIALFIIFVEKEAMFVDMAVQFRRFLEYMKTWGGKEIVPIALTGVKGTQMIERLDEAA
jgi:hypothetical protein